MRKRVRVVACTVPLLLAVACGSSKGSGSATTAASATTTAAGSATTAASTATTAAGTATTAAGTTQAPAAAPDPAAAGVAKAKAAIAAVADPPTKIGPTIKLSGKPAKKTVAWLQCELPDCKTFGAAFKEATTALGWDLKVISVQSFSPQEGFQQAIDAGVDYIAIPGTPGALMQEQIAAAKAKGIGFASCYATDTPSKAANILTECGDGTSAANSGRFIADWVIARSAGKAHTLYVNLPDFPVLVAEGTGVKAGFADNCPQCKLDELDVTINQLTAGEVPAAVVSKLQADPSIDYVHFSFGTLPTGVAEAIKAAGLASKVNLVGVDFDVAVGLQGIADGTYLAWTSNPKPYASWLMVDAFARDSLGMTNTEERANAVLPVFIVDSPDEAKATLKFGADGWPGPDGYQAQFKALWGV